jgi:integrase
MPANSFGPLALKTVRDEMLRPRTVTNPKTGLTREYSGCVRTVANRHTARLKQMFKWAAENELVPAAVFQALATVAGLRAGKSGARESEPVRPVPDDIVDPTLAHLSATVRAMVELQRITGMRSGEVVLMRGADVDRTRSPWLYRPARHKTAHHGHQRMVFLGPRAQGILQPFMVENPTAFMFSPAGAEDARHKNQRATRKSPVQPPQVLRAARSRHRAANRAPKDDYPVAAYRRAIARACEKAFKMPKDLSRALCSSLLPPLLHLKPTPLLFTKSGQRQRPACRY